MTKVVVLGAGGIIGQHMVISQPKDVDVSFYRRTSDDIYKAIDLTDRLAVGTMYDEKPDVIINLSGENRVDIVEQNPEQFKIINVTAPHALALWCSHKDVHLIQVSTQGVFSGENPPYGPLDAPDPITSYGKQKAEAESLVLTSCHNSTIARATFVLGVRPFQHIGRINPLEQMFEQREQKQVNDRWFSPAFAPDAAAQLWKLALNPKKGFIHIGEPIKVSRYLIATSVYHDLYLPMEKRPKIQAVSHDYFPGIAPRPRDTTYAPNSMYDQRYIENIQRSYKEWITL